MIRLYTLKDISAFSSDAIYKICLSLDRYGLSEDTMESFDSYNEIFTAAISNLEKGDHIIIAAELNDYLTAKKDLISKLILEGSPSTEIADHISLNAGDDVSEIDVDSHCLAPFSSAVHLTSDGLYSGFTCNTLSGKLSYIPLDFMRLDEVLSSFIRNEENKTVEQKPEEPAFSREEIVMPDADITPSVEKLVSVLYETEKTVALSTGEATMWIYNLYDKIDNLTETVNFVEITDPPAEEDSDEDESMRIVRHAREAMYNTSSDFGAAVSEVKSTESEDGRTVYYAYVAVVDRSTAKAKKINTANPEDLELILPHAVSILSDTVCQKADIMNTAIAKIDYSDSDEDGDSDASVSKGDTVTISKGMIIFAAVVLVFAIVCPMIMTYFMLKPEREAATAPTVPVAQTAPTEITTDIFAGQDINGTSVPTTSNPFLVPSTSNPLDASVNANLSEPAAAEVSAATSAPAASSTKGVFTFYVFGYGHGVGMSQVGANYLASQGWTAAEILAHYYYDANTKIVAGDTYPSTIKYSGTAYKTREFIASALESEMGGSYQREALKAQAIAIYTFAKYNGFNLYADATAFGKTPSKTVYSVVDEVIAAGYYIAHGNDVAITPFHAMSAGLTTSYYNVWGKNIGASVPYLSGARKSYGDYLDSKFKSTYTISSEDFKSLVKKNAGLTLSGDPSKWISIITHDSAVREDIGYISSINVGGKVFTGNEFRIKVMEGRIRSHCFAFTYTPDSK